jgi:hypothetical protein
MTITAATAGGNRIPGKPHPNKRIPSAIAETFMRISPISG